jgi:hypothetical protein
VNPSKPLSPAVRTGNLVLKTRVDLVIRNLRHVQQALGTVKQRRTGLRRVLIFPERIDASIDGLDRALDRATDGYRKGSWPQVASGLDALSAELNELSQEASSLTDLVAELREAIMLDEEEVAKTDSVANAVHDFLKTAVSAAFGDDLAKLDELRSQIDAVGTEGEADPGEMRAAWTKYHDRLYVSSERLFEEYVDLVSGVALRDTGFDRGIARLAEGLLKACGPIGTYNWNTLTIPAREETLAVTAARIVRLGFPEWTIWTLPLTAYELGFDYADSDKNLSPQFAALGGDQDELLVLVADAFATYFLGPAYACAAILMRLNPAEAFTGKRLVAKRAAVILSALTQMGRATGVANHYAEITNRLTVEWEDALRQTGWGEPAGPGEVVTGDDSGAQSAVPRLTDDEQAAIDRLLRAFEPRVHRPLLWAAEAWPKIEEWAAKLRAGQEVLARDVDGLAELRYVLNAAWRARIAVRPQETDVDDPVQLENIAAAVERLLWTLVRAPKASDSVGDGGQPRPPLQVVRYPSRRRAQPGKDTA